MLLHTAVHLTFARALGLVHEPLQSDEVTRYLQKSRPNTLSREVLDCLYRQHHMRCRWRRCRTRRWLPDLARSAPPSSPGLCAATATSLFRQAL